MTTEHTSTYQAAQPLGVGSSEGLGRRAPKGVVAVLMGPEGRELADACDFSRSGPAGFSAREFQEMQAKRALALAAVAGLSSPALANAVDAYMAEQIMRAMCNRGCRVVLIPVGYDE